MALSYDFEPGVKQAVTARLRGESSRFVFIQESDREGFPFFIRSTSLMRVPSQGRTIISPLIGAIRNINDQLGRREVDGIKPKVGAIVALDYAHRVADLVAHRLGLPIIRTAGDQLNPDIILDPQIQIPNFAVAIGDILRPDTRAVIVARSLADREIKMIAGLFIVDSTLPQEDRALPHDPMELVASLTDIDTLFKDHPMQERVNAWRQDYIRRRGQIQDGQAILTPRSP